MNLDFFQLSRKPFSQVPAANGYVLVPSLKRELNRCLEAIDECRCPVMIAGPSGCGKSVLIALIENHFSREIRTVRLDCTSLANRMELIQALLGETGLKFGSESLGELRLGMINFLKSGEHCPNGLLLLVDEAQILTDEVLEELRLMTNLVCAGRSQVRLVLAGTLALEENVARKESFNQRIAVRCYPGSLSKNETMMFVLAQMQMAGRDGREIFQPSALEKIHTLSDGIARVICQIGDNALRCAAAERKSLINAAMIEAAWYDLQQLPAPAAKSNEDGYGSMAGHESVIEYGSLSDEPVKQSSRSRPGNEMEFESEPHQYSPGPIGATAKVERYEHDSHCVVDTDSLANVDATLTDLLRTLDDFEVSGNSMPATSSKFESRGTGYITDNADLNPAGESQQNAGSNLKAVDSATVFGNDFDREEKVVDIQSLRISSQNQTAARTYVGDLSEIVDPDSSPAWMPVGNEIVFPYVNEEHCDDRQSKAPRRAKSRPSRPSVDTSRDNDRKSDKKPNDSKSSGDDRDMFIVQQSTKSKPEDCPVEPATQETPTNATPTGSAVRMDYQALFRQLRKNMDVDQ